jgi:hypothetical protein
MLVHELRGRDIDLLGINIVGLTMSFLYTSFCMLVFFPFPHLKYLESSDNAKPSFVGICSSIMDVPAGFDFNRLKSEFSKKWVIAYSDDASCSTNIRQSEK